MSLLDMIRHIWRVEIPQALAASGTDSAMGRDVGTVINKGRYGA